MIENGLHLFIEGCEMCFYWHQKQNSLETAWIFTKAYVGYNSVRIQGTLL